MIRFGIRTNLLGDLSNFEDYFGILSDGYHFRKAVYQIDFSEIGSDA